MDENLIGYFLEALEPAERHEVEDYLRGHPEARQRLELLRSGLQPLAADKHDTDPPAGLCSRTLARLAEHQCRNLPPAPVIIPSSAAVTGRIRWRRADVFVAASILLCLGFLIPPGLHRLRYQHQLTGCTDNLREFGTALLNYTDLQAGSESPERAIFPVVAQQNAPRNVAGLFVPVLIDAGVLRVDVNVRCPGNGSPAHSSWKLDELRTMSLAEFNELAPQLSGCYAYSLGYRGEDSKTRGYSRADGSLPIVSDRPPFTITAGENLNRNSPNHGGRGQNVLFTDNHVEFLTGRLFDGDDIFLNQAQQVAPGLHRADHVLGASASSDPNVFRSDD